MIQGSVRPAQMAIAAFLIVLAILNGVILVWGPARAMEGDAGQYLAIGRSLASGNGYKDTVGPWPDEPAYDRMPGWPAVIAIGLKLLFWIPPEAAMRAAGALVLALTASVFVMLQTGLGITPWFSLWGALAVALSPAMIVFVLLGDSEVLFLLLASAGAAAILIGGQLRFAGAALWGLTPLVRTNFVLMPFMLAGVLLIFPAARRELKERSLGRLGILLLLAIAPTFAWAVRNYPLTGRFPFLSSLEGETLYGGNNQAVATDLALWGYGIVPDQLPGEEILKIDLARGHNDLYLNDYYHRKAVDWIRTHRADLPRLILGKLVRGFVPVPWVPLAASWVAFGYRFLLDILALLLAWWWIPAARPLYLAMCLGMFLIVLITTLIYFGTYRYVHPVELFSVPCIVLGIQHWWTRGRT